MEDNTKKLLPFVVAVVIASMMQEEGINEHITQEDVSWAYSVLLSSAADTVSGKITDESFFADFKELIEEVKQIQLT